MFVFYCYFVGGWYGSGVTPVMLQPVPDYKEQLVDYYGVYILLNWTNLAVRAVFYCLYGGIHLFNYRKKRPAWQHFVARLISFTFTAIDPNFTDKNPPQSKQ